MRRNPYLLGVRQLPTRCTESCSNRPRLGFRSSLRNGGRYCSFGGRTAEGIYATRHFAIRVLRAGTMKACQQTDTSAFWGVHIQRHSHETQAVVIMCGILLGRDMGWRNGKHTRELRTPAMPYRSVTSHCPAIHQQYTSIPHGMAQCHDQVTTMSPSADACMRVCALVCSIRCVPCVCAARVAVASPPHLAPLFPLCACCG